MLANLLPGFRHTRVPFVAGALWLLVAWLLLGDRLLPDADGGRVERLLYELGSVLGQPAVLAALALLATLIGGMTPRVPVKWIARRLPINDASRAWQPVVCSLLGVRGRLANAQGDFVHWLTRFARTAPGDLEWFNFSGRECPPVLQAAARDLAESGATRMVGKRLTTSEFIGTNDGSNDAGDVSPYAWLHSHLAELSIMTELDSELPLQLHVQRESVFLEYDRLRSESELRSAIVIPVLLVVAVLCAESGVWVLAAGIPLWLLRQAVQSYVEADQQLLTAVRYRVIQSSTIAFIESLRPMGPPPGMLGVSNEGV